jgi:hypothetical protein
MHSSVSPGCTPALPHGLPASTDLIFEDMCPSFRKNVQAFPPSFAKRCRPNPAGTLTANSDEKNRESMVMPPLPFVFLS